MVCLLPLGHRRGRQPHSSCSGGCGAFCRPGSPSPQPPVALRALGQQVLGLCPQSLGGRGGVKLTCSQQARTSERLSPILLGAPGPPLHRLPPLLTACAGPLSPCALSALAVGGTAPWARPSASRRAWGRPPHRGQTPRACPGQEDQAQTPGPGSHAPSVYKSR